MVIQSQVTVLHLDLSKGVHWERVEALKFIYDDIAKYIIRSIDGNVDPFDIISVLKSRLVRICGVRYTDELFERVEVAMSSAEL